MQPLPAAPDIVFRLGDPLNAETQWLYYNFIAGTLDDAGYLSGFAYGNADSYNALQQAIWYYEGEITLAMQTRWLQASSMQLKGNLQPVRSRS